MHKASCALHAQKGDQISCRQRKAGQDQADQGEIDELNEALHSRVHSLLGVSARRHSLRVCQLLPQILHLRTGRASILLCGRLGL